MITVKHRGNFNKIERFFQNAKDLKVRRILEAYGKEGVAALSSATPVDTGKTAASWSYEIHTDGKTHKISWTNSNVNKGVNIALILQMGHGTRNGGYVEGIDYINPALKSVFTDMAEEIWGEVTKV